MTSGYALVILTAKRPITRLVAGRTSSSTALVDLETKDVDLHEGNW